MRCAWLLLIVLGCSKPDPCEAALDRLERIWKKQGISPPRARLIDSCKHGKYAQYDPVLRCAMDSDSDETAAKCIDDFTNGVLKPIPGEPQPTPKLPH